jgi:hypothetical protein
MKTDESKKLLGALIIISIFLIGLAVFSYVKEKSKSAMNRTSPPTQAMTQKSPTQITELIEKGTVLFEGQIKSISREKYEIVVLTEESTKETTVVADPSKTLIFKKSSSPEQNASDITFSDLEIGMLIVVYGNSTNESPVLAEGIAVDIQPTIYFRNQSEQGKILQSE